MSYYKTSESPAIRTEMTGIMQRLDRELARIRHNAHTIAMAPIATKPLGKGEKRALSADQVRALAKEIVETVNRLAV